MLPRRRDLFGLNLLDDGFFKDFFNTPFLRVEGKNPTMQTDIREKDGKYLVDINLPGFKREDIKVSFESGYLTIEATTNSTHEDKNENYLIKERYIGTCKRSFYVGEVSENDIEAAFENGTLTLVIPKQIAKEIENKKYIDIK